MSIVDELITVYKLDDRYSGELNRIADKTSELGENISRVTARAAAILPAIAIGAVIDLGVQAIRASASLEKLRLSLQFLTGSAQLAKSKLDFIRQLSVSAVQPFGDLAEAGVELERFGLRLEQFLPLIAKLNAFPGSPGLEALARQVGEITEGQLPRKQVLASVGLGKQDFAAQGIKFDPNGKLISSANDTLNALKRIVDSKYGGILDTLATTTDSKLTSVNNKFQETLAKIGDALKTVLIPVLDRMSKFLDNLAKSDGFDKFLKNIASGLHKFVGVIFASLTILLAIFAIVNLALHNFISAALFGVAAVAALFGGAAITKALGRLVKSLGKDGNGDNGAVPTDSGPNFEPGKDPTQEQIAENTRRTATAAEKQLDLRRVALGGGPLGSLGVTPIELYGRRGAGRNTIQVQVSGTRNLERFMDDLVQQTVAGMIRQGVFTPGR